MSGFPMTRMNGHAKAYVTALASDEPLVRKVMYDRVVSELIETKAELKRTRAGKCQVEEILAQERAIFAAEKANWGRRG